MLINNNIVCDIGKKYELLLWFDVILISVSLQ